MKGLEIKELREKLGMTQEKLGLLIGVSRNTIINYEKGGKIPDSKREILSKILTNNAQNNTQENNNDVVFDTGFDKKIAEHEEKIREIQKEILKWEEKIIQDPEKKATYEKYIASYEERIFLLNEIINLTLEAKKDFLENNDD